MKYLKPDEVDFEKIMEEGKDVLIYGHRVNSWDDILNRNSETLGCGYIIGLGEDVIDLESGQGMITFDLNNIDKILILD